MAAGFAAASGGDVTVFEKMPRVGRKLMITGKGRCNLTNDCDVQTFLQNVTVNPRFLYSAAYNFPPSEIIEFFQSLGLKTKVERGDRVFPLSDKARDAVDALRGFAVNNGAKIVTGCVEDVITANGCVSAVRAQGKLYPCRKLIIACGGLSYPKTGSTGDGFKFAEKTGHTVITPRPSLVPLVSPDSICADAQGLSLKNIALKITDKNGRVIYKDFGELLFTHFGLSGPVILSASCHMRRFDAGGYTAGIDLKPALDEEQLDRRIQRDFKENLNRSVSNSLNSLLPKKLISPVLVRWGVEGSKKCNSVTREERRRLVILLKNFTVKITGTRPIDEAVVTSGGVKVSEINPKTMESKIVKNLYFAGEVIDVDGYTGGFNLTIAWMTGRLSGESAAM